MDADTTTVLKGLTAWELSCVTGRPLPEVLRGMKNGSIPYECVGRKPTQEALKKMPEKGD